MARETKRMPICLWDLIYMYMEVNFNRCYTLVHGFFFFKLFKLRAYRVKDFKWKTFKAGNDLQGYYCLPKIISGQFLANVHFCRGTILSRVGQSTADSRCPEVKFTTLFVIIMR